MSASIPIHEVVKPAKERGFKWDPNDAPTEDYHDQIFELEKQGEWEVQRVPEPYIEVENSVQNL